MTLVLASHLLGETPFTSDCYPVSRVECREPFDYWRGVAKAWSSAETIVNIEHDVECSDHLIGQLLGCDQPLCAYAYSVYRATQHEWVWAAWDEGMHHIRKGAPLSDHAAIGFCKIEHRVRTTESLAKTHWKWLESTINKSVVGPWHIHWPAIRHSHEYAIDPLAELLQTTGVSTGGEIPLYPAWRT